MKQGNPKLDAIVKRPVKHLAYFAAHYPGIWREHDRLRSEYNALAKWPRWCYAPVAVTSACLFPDYKGSPPDDATGLVASVAALAAWRLTKGIYLFDEDAFELIWGAKEVKGLLPVEVLQRLPERCVYVPFPVPRTIEYPNHRDEKCYGFFAQLDWTREGPTWLDLILDTDETRELPPWLGADESPFQIGSLHSYSLKLGSDLAECFNPTRHDVELEIQKQIPQLTAAGIDPMRIRRDTARWLSDQESNMVRPMISILLWLCSSEPEIACPDPLRGLRTKRTRKGLRNFGPDEPRLYEVAYRFGAKLRLNAEAAARGIPGEGSHASPRPHIRRAHWHGFWTGPKASISKDQPSDRKLVVKFIAEIAVCVGPDDAVIPTIHPVVLAEGRHDERFRIDHS